MYETPSLHKFGYSSEQLKLREYQKAKRYDVSSSGRGEDLKICDRIEVIASK